ncbi:lysine-specific demethylase lid isoform X2 [Aricia agestis]|uniref:lysine-specific demethylase lid isoform X2 n=1 Tax=Aricia agestis TaxID=91739 RepID=UPI001C202E65|nr:lysine-specific demethylase lid isoform X2 [Aricia agestis]
MGKCDEANVEVNMGDSASPMKPDNFTFTVPPEAPVFEPTVEEFQDPLAYISKIRHIAEKSGICKIKPPAHWQPPFAVDVDRLRFTPRIQRLNELEAITRVKLNFLDQIIKFWELQGSVLKIPTVERKPLDLYALHKLVKEAGGFEVCSAERKWSKIARRMGHPQGKGVGSILKNHYERILYPYDVFKNNGVLTDNKETKIEVKSEQTPEKVGRRSSSKPPATPSPARRYKSAEPEPAEGSHTEGALPSDTKTPVKEEPGETRRSPRENKWMSSAGSCGARARVLRSTKLREHRLSNMTVSVTPAPPVISPDDPLAKYMCHVCGRGDVEEQMLLCDGCDDSYHTFCLVPPLADVPKGDWRCPVCLAEEVSKPTEAFGFEQASREYTLQQFGEMADQFKSDYFNMPVHMVPTSAVEREFWRVVSSIDEDVTVEYGADLHSMDHGSGFPTKSSAHLYPGEQQYAESSWNLNNLPVLEGSVLGHINADISGMKIPWLYVGMCFATFCWHNEDHWSYSINYLHWGEPKTWYGVPSSKAEQFEATMKAEAPELFQLQPDLLHQLVTIMNPNVLMKAGVPVYRCDQNAGEFVITFPRAYHAGFNQGYNFAEAVNFTPADWLKMGRECISHYSTLRRYCVFSHDELVCKMALEAESLTLTVALAAYRDMRTMLHDERKLRKALLDWGVTEAEREAFELLPDDERQCHECKTTCFLSCVTCACTPHIACPRHYSTLCSCPPALHKLRYRYTLDELPAMLEKLKRKSDLFREWAEAVQNALDPDTPKTCDLDGLRAHLKRAHDLKMHKTELVRALETAIEDAEKCATVIQQLDLNKMRTRTRHHDPKYRLTVHELTLFAAEIDGLACVLPEGSAVKEVLRQTEEFEDRATDLLNKDLDDTDSAYVKDLEEVCDLGGRLCIVLPQLAALTARAAQARWLLDARDSRAAAPSPAQIEKLLQDATTLVPHARLEPERAALQKLRLQIEDWEARVKAVLIEPNSVKPEPSDDAEPQHTTLAELETLLAEGDDIDATLPSHHALHTAISHAKDWLSKVEEMQSKELYPYMHSVEALVRRGSQIPLALYEKDQLAAALHSAHEWKRGAAEMFLKKNWSYSLLEALSPRAGPAEGTGRRRGRGECSAALLEHFSEDASPTEIVAAFKNAEQKELAYVKELRIRNLRKDVCAPPAAGLTFCTCQKRQYGVMSQCEICKDWFHASCVAGAKEEPDGGDSPERTDPPPEPKFICPDCTRTKRPRLHRILALLVWLQKLPVRLAEGEALQCVTERAMAWQDAARAQLSALPPRALAKDSHVARSSANLEHAYSASPRSPSARVTPGQLQKLEDLMLEGDLLEVRLEEQAGVWSAVCAARAAEGRGARVLDAGRRKRAQRQPRPHRQLKRTRPHAAATTTTKTIKRGSSTTTNYLNRKQGLSSGSGLMMRKHYMARQERRKRGLPTTRGKLARHARPVGQARAAATRAGPSRQESSSSSESSAEDDEDCAAESCLRPTGKIYWVQCDGGCDQWFHMHCVGLSHGALREDDDYVCGACAQRRSAGKPRPAPTSRPAPASRPGPLAN